MDGALGLVLGMFLGGSLGVFAMALVSAARYGDERLDDYWGRDMNGKNDREGND